MGNQKSKLNPQGQWWENQCVQSKRNLTLWELMNANDKHPFSRDELVEKILLLTDKSLGLFAQKYVEQQNLGAITNPTRTVICRETAELLFQYHDEQKGSLQDVLESCSSEVLHMALPYLENASNEEFHDRYREFHQFRQDHDINPMVDQELDEIRFNFDEGFNEANLNEYIKQIQEGKIRIVTFGAQDDVIRLANVLPTNKTVISLNLFLTDVGIREAQALADALRHNHTLTKLSFVGVLLDMDVLEAFANVNFGNLTDIEFLRNNISDNGAVAIARALQTNTTLLSLKIRENPIGEKGVVAIAESLQTNHTLTELYLVVSDVDLNGARALAETLKVNTSLRILNLFDNEIGNDGVTVLAEGLVENGSLEELNLGGNRIQDEGAITLANILPEIKLSALYLYDNPITDVGGTALVQGLANNTSLIKLELPQSIDREIRQLIRDKLTFNRKRLKVIPRLRAMAEIIEPDEERSQKDNELLWDAGHDVMARMMPYLREKKKRSRVG